MQNFGVVFNLLAQPAFKIWSAVDPLRDTLVVVLIDGLLIHQQITLAGFVFQVFDLLQQFPIVAPELGPGVKITLHQGEANKYLPCLYRIDGAIVHLAPGNQGDAEQGNPFIGPHLAPLLLPVGL